MKPIAAVVCAALVFAAVPSYAAPDETAIRTAVARFVPGETITRIRASALPGLAEVTVGGHVLYASDDGRLLLNGSLLDTANGTDLTEASRAELRAATLATLPAAARISFEPDSAAAHRVTVFTALDCGYCQRFHADIAGYLGRGIAVDYVLIPRGEGTAELSARVFCAADRQAAFSAATFGEPFEAGRCSSAYADGVAAARALRIDSTPTIFDARGQRVGGYLTPDQLAQRLAALAAR